jgi:hypothetical protein
MRTDEEVEILLREADNYVDPSGTAKRIIRGRTQIVRMLRAEKERRRVEEPTVNDIEKLKLIARRGHAGRTGRCLTLAEGHPYGGGTDEVLRP